MIQTDINTALDVVQTMRMLHNTPQSWTKYSYARNRSGDPVEVTAVSAVSYCEVGVRLKALYLHSISHVGPALRILNDLFFSYPPIVEHNNGISGWNDTEERTYDDIVVFEQWLENELVRMKETA